MSTLYIVGTPIGNLGDISPRAIETLKSVDFIAAEDTRVSLKLLNHFGVKKPLVSYYEHNLRQRGEQIVARILAGETCAVVTDAGMPCISDPGEDLVRLCAQAGVPVVAIPGPSAAVSALAVSGLSTSRFSFEGFLSVKKSSRMEHLRQIAGDTRTLVFYEAPHKLPATLKDMLEALGDRKIALARELTKLYEEVRRTTLREAAAYYAENSPRGEFVLVVEGAPPEEAEQIPFDKAVGMARALIDSGTRAAVAAKEVSRETGHRRSDLYRALMEDDCL